MKKIEIEIPDGKRAEWVNGVLTLVDEKPKDVTERIKTFEDAFDELGREHLYVKSYCRYLAVHNEYLDLDDTDILAYLKLRIVCAALNEGWEPKYTEDEMRHYPWFRLYSKDELENMPEEEKKSIVIIDTGGYVTEYAGFAYENSGSPSNEYADYSSPLCFKNHALSVYCGKQFINLWADYLLPRKK